MSILLPEYMKVTTLILLPLLIFFEIATGQTQKDYTIKQFTTENGLPSNGIKGIQWDASTGFLWIATEAGISRFDGINFKTFNKENTPSIATERMMFIIRNHNGKIYSADAGGNLVMVMQNRIAAFDTINYKKDPFSGLYLIAVSDTFFKAKKDKNMSGDFSMIYSKVASINDTACFIRNQRSLYYYSISMEKPVLYKTGNVMARYLFKIANSYFITDSLNQTYQLDIKTGSVTSTNITFDTKSTVDKNRIIYWENGMKNPLLFQSGNVYLLHVEQNELKAKLLFTNIPTDNYLRSAQYSEELKILFIGTDSKGVSVFYTNRVASKKRKKEDIKNRNAVYAQVELPNGNILTNEGDVIGDAAFNQADLPINDKFNFAVFTYNNTLLCYVKYNPTLGFSHFFTYNYLTKKTTPYPKIRLFDGAGYATLNGSLSITTESGIGVLEGDSLRYLIRFKRTATSNMVFQSLEVEPGVVVFATCSGLFRYHANSNSLDTLFTKLNFCVRSIWQYKDYLFFGTYGAGFYMYKNGKVKQMPLDKNNYLLYTHCFVPDDKGYCFLSTNRGLFKANIEQLIHAFEQDNQPVYYFFFGKNDGMEMTELNGGCTPCALILKNKTISFPTMDGLLWVDPEKANTVMPGGDIYIDEILIDNKQYYPNAVALQSLPAETSEIQIKLAIAGWSNKENIYIEYKLNNAANWSALNIEKGMEITFNNLPPGKYQLQIRKLNGFGINNYSYKKIEFYITIPWYKQWWFYALSALTLFGLIVLYFQLRTKQFLLRQRNLEKQVSEKTKELQQQNEVLEKNNTIKTRLISIISHDIVTPLKFVTVAGKNLLEKRSMMNEALQQETLQEITNTAQELQLLSTNILNWIKYQNENRRMVKETFDVFEVVKQVQSILNTLAKQKNLQLINNVTPGIQVTQYFEPLKILVYNLLTNAIHFTAQGNITISSQQNDTNIIISVKDDGCGMSQEQIQNIVEDRFVISAANVDNKKGHGLGYLIIKDLIKMMGATIQIESQIGKGTTVHIILLA